MRHVVDIIIPSWNLSDYTTRCVNSIQKNTKNFRVTIIDNGSDVDHGTRLSKLVLDDSVRIVRNETNIGFTNAVNQGIAIAEADYVCLLNNDTEVSDGWMERLLEICETDATIGAVGPLATGNWSWQTIGRLWKDPRLAHEFPELHRIAQLSFEDAAKQIKQHYSGQILRVKGMIAFFCVVIPRRVINIVGDQDDSFPYGFAGDDDYCKRIRKAGFQIVVAKDVLIHHNHRTTFRALLNKDEIDQALEDAQKVLRTKWKRPASE